MDIASGVKMVERSSGVPRNAVMKPHHSKRATPSQPAMQTQTAIASGGKKHLTQLFSAEDIRLIAYRKWENAGKPVGDGTKFWLEAENELMKEKSK
jgi:hypothetical protein